MARKKIDDFGTVETEAGIAAVHPSRYLPIYVAPATRDEFSTTTNTVRLSMDPIACWRMDDARFDFDSSFVLPAAKEELTVLANMITSQPDMPMSIFGHADPVGDDAYNITLSGRRAKAVYTILTRDVNAWEDFWNDTTDGWQRGNVANTMLATFSHDDDPDTHYDGTKPDEKKLFRQAVGPDGKWPVLSAGSGLLGVDGRKKLYRAYMDYLCPVEVTAKAFLSQGADKKHKGDYQGCGKFNPVLILSKQQMVGDKDTPALTTADRDEKNSINRRVVLFFYEPGTIIDPKKWPCPAPITSGSGGANIPVCKNRFWSDADKRKTPNDVDPKVFKDTFDTFECRFYQRIAGWSPCEGGQVVKYWVIRFLQPNDKPPAADGGTPLANEPFEATFDGSNSRRVAGQTDSDGILRIRKHDDFESMQLRIAGRMIHVRAGNLAKLADSDPSLEDVASRLFNLGYGPPNPHTWSSFTNDDYRSALKTFQQQHAVADSEVQARDVGTDTIAKLRKFHDGLDNGSAPAAAPSGAPAASSASAPG